MAEERGGPASTVPRQPELLQQLEALARQQAAHLHGLRVELLQLRRVLQETENRRTAMVSGSRASPAEVHAIINTLRVATPPGAAPAEPDASPAL